MTRYDQEWQTRKVVMEAILEALRDGKPRTARQILHSLPEDEWIQVDKKLVNSILSSEAKRYVFRDNGAHTYRIREAENTQFVQPPWDLARKMIMQEFQCHGPLTVSELKEVLENNGFPVPKWMIKAILSGDDFRFSSAYSEAGATRQKKDERKLSSSRRDPYMEVSRPSSSDEREIEMLLNDIAASL